MDIIGHKHIMAIKNECLRRIEFCIAFFETLIANENKSYAVINFRNILNISCKLAKSFVKKYFNADVICTKVHANITLEFKDNSVLNNISHQNEEFKNILSSLNFVKSNLENILIYPPDDLLRLNSEFKDNYNEKFKNNVVTVLRFIFPYEILINNGFKFNGSVWNNYSFTKELGLQTCPYCNRSWISTVTNGLRKQYVINAQLDHFFSQEHYPLLRLSFFNLVPSCELCNSRLKRDEKLNDSFLNPYMDGYNEDGKFFAVAKDILSCLGLDSNYKVGLKTPNEPINREKAEKIRRNHNLFEIDKIYENHGDIISDIYRKNYLYSNRYISFLKTQFPAINENFAELYRFTFNNYFENSDFIKRPFSKLIKDITEELGLIDRMRPS